MCGSRRHCSAHALTTNGDSASSAGVDNATGSRSNVGAKQACVTSGRSSMVKSKEMAAGGDWFPSFFLRKIKSLILAVGGRSVVELALSANMNRAVTLPPPSCRAVSQS